MKKFTYILFIFSILLSSCNNASKSEKKDLEEKSEILNELCVIVVEPNDSILSEIQKKQGENFDYAVFSDILYYVGTSYEYFDSLGVKVINTKGKSEFKGYTSDGKLKQLNHDWFSNPIAVYGFSPKTGFKQLEIYDIPNEFKTMLKHD